MFKEHIEYDNMKTLEEAMRKVNLCYDQNKNKRESVPTWKAKKQDNFDPRIRNNKFHRNKGNDIKGIKAVTRKNLKHKILR